jgi:hypothetical protein
MSEMGLKEFRFTFLNFFYSVQISIFCPKDVLQNLWNLQKGYHPKNSSGEGVPAERELIADESMSRLLLQGRKGLLCLFC